MDRHEVQPSSPPAASTLADGDVNIPPSLTIPGTQNGDFGEAAINLTNTIGDIACGEFSGAYMKTRASTAINAALKDFTDSSRSATGVCPPSSAVSKAVRNATTNPAGLFTGAVDAKAGDAIDYQITYMNSGAGAANNVVVSDTINAGQTYVADSCLPKPCSLTGNVLKWELGTVAATTNKVLTFQVSLTGPFAAGTTTTIKNLALVTTTEEGLRPPSNETTVTVRTPNSSLDKAVRNFTTSPTGAFTNTATAVPGQTIEYQLSYTNTGPGSATGVVLTDTVAESRRTCPARAAVRPAGRRLVVRWDLGTVAAGTTRTVTFMVTLTGPFTTPTTEVKNIAALDTNEEPAENSDETTVTVTSQPNSSLDKSVRNFTTNPTGSFTNTVTASPGNVIEYRLFYENTGAGNATNVVITDTVQARQTYLSCTGGCTTSGTPTVVRWDLGTVLAGTSRTVTFKVTLDASFPAGTTPVKNIAAVDTGEEPPENSDETTVNVACEPELVARQVGAQLRRRTRPAAFTNTATASPGNVIEYQLVYQNTGNAPATNVVITDTVAGASRRTCRARAAVRRAGRRRRCAGTSGPSLRAGRGR